MKKMLVPIVTLILLAQVYGCAGKQIVDPALEQSEKHDAFWEKQKERGTVE